MSPNVQQSRLLVLGANGPTGRETVTQALERGYSVDALTRHPESFPVEHDRLRVLAGDATDPATIDDAVSTATAVVCTIGASFTWRAVDVYSRSAQLVVDAMMRHGSDRLVVVTSAGVASSHQPMGAVEVLGRTLMRRTLGRTVYDDMVRMERIVSTSPLAWTIVRPPGLLSEPARGYVVERDEVEGKLCTRADLACMLLDQLDEDRFVRAIAAVATPGLTVGAIDMFRREVLKR